MWPALWQYVKQNWPYHAAWSIRQAWYGHLASTFLIQFVINLRNKDSRFLDACPLLFLHGNYTMKKKKRNKTAKLRLLMHSHASQDAPPAVALTAPIEQHEFQVTRLQTMDESDVRLLRMSISGRPLSILRLSVIISEFFFFLIPITLLCLFPVLLSFFSDFFYNCLAFFFFG